MEKLKWLEIMGQSKKEEKSVQRNFLERSMGTFMSPWLRESLHRHKGKMYEADQREATTTLRPEQDARGHTVLEDTEVPSQPEQQDLINTS